MNASRSWDTSRGCIGHGHQDGTFGRDLLAPPSSRLDSGGVPVHYSTRASADLAQRLSNPARYPHHDRTGPMRPRHPLSVATALLLAAPVAASVRARRSPPAPSPRAAAGLSAFSAAVIVQDGQIFVAGPGNLALSHAIRTAGGVHVFARSGGEVGADGDAVPLGVGVGNRVRRRARRQRRPAGGGAPAEGRRGVRVQADRWRVGPWRRA